MTGRHMNHSTRNGKHTKNYGKSPFSIGKSTISMAIFNRKLLNYQRVTTKITMNRHRWEVHEYLIYGVQTSRMKPRLH